MAVVDFFDRGWRGNPDGPAYVMGDSSWTYDEAKRLSNRIARRLIQSVQPGLGKVAVVAANDAIGWICVLGIWRANMAWVPINPLSPANECAGLMAAFECDVVLYHAGQAELIEQIRARLPRVQEFVCIGLGSRPLRTEEAMEVWLQGIGDEQIEVPYAMDDIVTIAPTGGTTGFPKGVMNTHRSFSASLTHMMLALQYSSGEPIVNLVAAPMTHAAGIFSMPATARGGTVVFLPRAEPTAILDAIRRHGVTELFLAPTAIYRLLSAPGVTEHTYDSLRYLTHGAAPMSTDKLRTAIATFGPVLMELYGQQESPCAIAFKRPDENFVAGELASDDRLASCGRPYPLVRVEVLDEDGALLSPGETGEICVRGDLVMKGYFRNEVATKATVVDGWLHTGDLGHFDAEGYLHITDRKKDMIVSGGYNVYPSNAERVILSHPAIEDCAVIGIPDDDWGEAVTAVVECKAGHEVSASELITLCKSVLGSVQSPKSILFVDSLPRSPNGKVLKREVREPFWADRGRVI